MSEERLVRGALVGLHTAAVWGCVLAFGLPWLWLLPPLALASLRLRLPEPGPRIARLLPRVVFGLSGLVALLGLAWVLYVPSAEALVGRVPSAVGPVLCLIGTPLLFWLGSVPAHRGSVPASLGALLAAAFAAGPRFAGPVALAGLSAFAMLAAGAPPRRRLVRLGTGVVLSGMLALGITFLLPWAQPLAESAIARTVFPTSGVTGFGGPARLGDVQSLARSERPLLRLYARVPRRLRAETFTRFDGRTWKNPGDERERLVAAGPGSLPETADTPPGPWLERPGSATPTLPSNVWIATVHLLTPAPPLFVPFGLRAVKAEGGLELGSGGTLAAVSAAPRSYAVAADDVAGRLLNAADCPDCLTLPEKVDPRLVDLAEELARDAPDPAERVQRTLRHLDACCRYTLEVGAFRSADPLSEFLFEKQAGYCEYFASAAAILLRLQGVPTRYVKGLQAGAAPWHGDHYLVRDREAHAWIDARLPEGWVEFDPTPASDYATVHDSGSPGLLARVREWIASRAARARAALGVLDLRALGRIALDVGPWAGGAFILVLLWRLIRRRGRLGRSAFSASEPLRPELAAVIRRFDACCAQAGWPRPSTRGLLDHLAALPPERFGPVWRAAARELALGVYAEVYGGRTADAALLARRAEELQRLPII